MTVYDAVLEAAGVSRQAATVWQKAAKIADANPAAVDEYVAASIAMAEDITTAGFLSWAAVKHGLGDSGSRKDDEDPPTHACPICGLLHEIRRQGGGE